jgi:WhiB family transcriptional regulator, redox-sensing transcriptional regulator
MPTSWNEVQPRGRYALRASVLPVRDAMPSPPTFELPEWMSRGTCAQTDPDAFFPEKGGSTREAKKVCRSCPVRRECLEYALENDERFGIWGGVSERARRAVNRRLRAGWTVEATREWADDPDSPVSLDLVSPQRRRVSLDAPLSADVEAAGW